MANPADIVDIIQTPILIKDSFIRRGKVVLDEKQNPVHYTGGFAIVFPFLVDGEKWAFRCWYNSVGNVGKRLKILSEELGRLNLPYFSKFKYVENGIALDGSIRPTTRMRWIDGLNIKDYICNHSKEPSVLYKLADDFKKMCHDMHINEIAHGDLQHGNIIVDSSTQIYLIDYDSVYLPVFKGEKDIITGLGAYQHPSRINNQNVFAHEKLDYFSELIIYLSILAIAISPDLVEQFNVEKGENLLFVKSDFVNFRNSHVYKTLQSLRSEEISKWLNVLEEYLSLTDINDLKPFESYLETNEISLYCIKCGKSFEDKNDMFCTECGTKRI